MEKDISYEEFTTFIETFYLQSLKELKEMDEEIEYEMFSDDFDYSGLPTMKDWLGDYPVWDTPWWYRDDALTIDGYAESEKDLAEWRKAAEEENLEELNREIFTDIEESVRNAVKQVTDQGTEKGTLVEVDFNSKSKKKTWKPKLV